MLYVVNLNFDSNRQGEVVQADPALVAGEVAAGYLSPIDEQGRRIIPAPEPEQEA